LKPALIPVTVATAKLLIFKLATFVAKDFAEASSYRFAFVLRYVGALFTVLVFYFISGLVQGQASPHLAPYGSSYFEFVLVGLALAGYLRTSMTTFAYLIRNAQMTGTMEALLVTQTRLPTIILGSSIYSFGVTSTTVILYLLVGALVFGVDLSRANIPAALLVLVLSIIAFSSMGIVLASLIVMFKRGESFLSMFTQLPMLFGGVYFPVSILPGWLQIISTLLPITYALNAMRSALYHPSESSSFLGDVLILALFATVALPVSLWIFSRAVDHARASGSLGHY